MEGSLVILILFSVSLSFCWFFEKNGVWFQLNLLFLAWIIGVICDSVYRFRHFLGKVGKLIYIFFQGKTLRISYAYLVRIKIRSKFFLIRGTRINQFQPVGGVYQFYDRTILDRFHLSDDTALREVPPDDLRLVFRTPKDIFRLCKFKRWFDSQRAREISPHREFYEEISQLSFFDTAVFKNLKFEFKRRVDDGLLWSQHLGMYEHKIFDIFDLILNSEQESLLERTLSESSESFKWVERGQIESLGYSRSGDEMRIGSHAKYLI
ncbi:MAG: hypothetical protein JWQ35_2392 [Bacteriovoracaceae bacterium]|nr:hypothetical protein [Bacteriovoracaceae bacterium]